MPNEYDPIIDQWYLHRDKGEPFRVVDVDAGAGVIEIQDFEGNVEQLDLEEWRELNLDLGAEPEDWTGPFDDIEPEDIDSDNSGTMNRD
jgi:hypothetical protein